MNIQVLATNTLRLSRFDLDELNISLENDVKRYCAISMFVTSLGRCTFAVLDHYAKRMKVSTQNIILELTWSYDQKENKVNQIRMEIYWPEAPGKRLPSIEKAAHKCAISNTIKNCVDIEVRVLDKED